jgi:hypothetical protein
MASSLMSSMATALDVRPNQGLARPALHEQQTLEASIEDELVKSLESGH